MYVSHYSISHGYQLQKHKALTLTALKASLCLLLCYPVQMRIY